MKSALREPAGRAPRTGASKSASGSARGAHAAVEAIQAQRARQRQQERAQHRNAQGAGALHAHVGADIGRLQSLGDGRDRSAGQAELIGARTGVAVSGFQQRHAFVEPVQVLFGGGQIGGVAAGLRQRALQLRNAARAGLRQLAGARFGLFLQTVIFVLRDAGAVGIILENRAECRAVWRPRPWRVAAIPAPVVSSVVAVGCFAARGAERGL